MFYEELTSVKNQMAKLDNLVHSDEPLAIFIALMLHPLRGRRRKDENELEKFDNLAQSDVPVAVFTHHSIPEGPADTSDIPARHPHFTKIY
jgi:hypothetical protein